MLAIARRVLIALLATAGFVWLANPAAAKPFKDQFQSLEWRADSESGGGLYHYRLYVPPGAGKTARLPLLIWLHGNEDPQNKTPNLRWLHLVFEATGDSPPLFILAPQRSADEAWFSSVEDSADPLTATYKILEQVLAKYPVDPDRIYLCGVSTGGTACWELACRHPERFAALAPMASAGGDRTKAARLVKIPIWAFHAKYDKVISPNMDRAMVAAIQAAGGIADLTETEPKVGATDHNCWSAAFEDFKLVDWLLAQHRNAPVSEPPGASAGTKLGRVVTSWLTALKNFAWITLPWFALALGIRLFWVNEQKRRQADADIGFNLHQ
jgi:predicted peptidase